MFDVILTRFKILVLVLANGFIVLVSETLEVMDYMHHECQGLGIV